MAETTDEHPGARWKGAERQVRSPILLQYDVQLDEQGTDRK